MASTDTEAKKAWMRRQLRRALVSLYDPRVLNASPLNSLLGTAERCEPGSSLRRTLSGAIESLRPGKSTPTGSRSWRVYQILRRRYIEQLTQQEVANDLGLSVRHLQREEKLAREVLADYLWNTFDLQTRAVPGSTARADSDDDDDDDEEEDGPSFPSRDDELARLRDSVSPREVDIDETIQEALAVLEPLRVSTATRIDYEPRGDHPPLQVGHPMLKQALLNILSVAIRLATAGSVKIETVDGKGEVSVEIVATLPAESERIEDRVSENQESLAMAEQLVSLCEGDLQIETSGPSPNASHASGMPDQTLSARMRLPSIEQETVLVIDDNADVLQLFRRYLVGSRYSFLGSQTADEGLALAQQEAPDIVVLDVMMPGRDGWAVLSQLREHPVTHSIPIIVCTILAQRELALVLGAADFVRKPVNRGEFLAALDRQAGPQATESA